MSRSTMSRSSRVRAIVTVLAVAGCGVEQALKHHPAVYDVLVVGIPDDKFGQAVAALIQPREGETLELDEHLVLRGEVGAGGERLFGHASTVAK